LDILNTRDGGQLPRHRSWRSFSPGSCFRLRPHANCYELIGCTNKDYFKAAQLKQLSCQILWEVRNTIYKERGYCFHTQRGIKFFGNAGCKYDDAGAVPLNGAERYNVRAIKKVAKKGCS
jgi:hypothetical protein